MHDPWCLINCVCWVGKYMLNIHEGVHEGQMKDNKFMIGSVNKGRQPFPIYLNDVIMRQFYIL